MNETGRPSWFETARGVLNLGFCLGFFIIFESSVQDSLFGHQAIDLLAAAGVILVSRKNGHSLPDSLLWVMLSRRLHLDAMNQMEAFQALVPVFWGIWGIAFAGARTEFQRMILLGWHLNLTIDAGTTRSLGMGMSPGWETAALNLLLLSGLAKSIMNTGVPQSFAAGTLSLALSLAFIFFSHFHGPGSYITGTMTVTIGLILLFFAVHREERFFTRFFQAVLVGSLPIVLAALGLALLGEPTLWLALQKRLFAGGLHPNLFAGFSLIALLYIAQEGDWEAFPGPLQSIVRWGCFLIYAVTLVFSGGRAALAIFFLVFALSRTDIKALKRHPAAALAVVLLPCLAWQFGFVPSFEEWRFNERFFIWQAAWENIRQAPWTGHGFMSFGGLSQVIDPVKALLVYDWNYPHTHNLLLELLLSGGIVGLGFFFAALWQWFRAATREDIRWSAGMACLCLGMFDFIWFLPSLIGMGVGLLVSKSRPLEISREPTPPPRAIRGLVLFFYFCASPGILLTGSGERLFQDGIALLGRGSPAWVQAVDSATERQPARLETRLQRLLFRWSTSGFTPQGDLTLVSGLLEKQPDYYLLYFLKGRIHYLKSEFDRAEKEFRKSVDLEPHDTMGIRWAFLALAGYRAGGDWFSPAVKAVSRGYWGDALILDHPTLGPVARTRLASAFSDSDGSPLLQLQEKLRVGLALTRREVEFPLDAFLREWEEKKDTLPAWEQTLLPAITRAWTRKAIAASPPLWATLENFETMEIPELTLYLPLAYRQMDPAHFFPLLREIERKWPYRGKNNEYLTGTYLSTFFPTAEKSGVSAVETMGNLLPKDPGNPWLMERLGDILRGEGKANEAKKAYESAFLIARTSMREPVFSDGPRPWVPGPTGEEWTYAFERALRRHDPEAVEYHAEVWKEFFSRLRKKIQEP